MRALLTAMLILPASAAQAEGFATRDLSSLGDTMQDALGAGFSHRAEAERVTLNCPSCADHPMIDVRIGRQDDGTEDRVRSGETTIARLEEICRARDPDCRIAALDVAPAIGWRSSYGMGPMHGTTAVVLRDGDLLTIRSLAAERSVAQANVDRLVPAIVDAVVGR